jgi:trans-aconitate 2-methyltransferase
MQRPLFLAARAQKMVSSTPLQSIPAQASNLATRSYRSGAQTKDWSAAQYLKFEAQRTRPARDLIAQVPLKSPKSIIDLGCGPGNSTAALAEYFPDAHVTGMDSSSDMIKTAKAALPHIDFAIGDLSSYEPKEPADLLFSNAVFQWIPSDQRIPIMKRLIESLQPGGVFAFQVPDNFLEPSHKAMREVAKENPWTETLCPLKPALDAFQTPRELFNELKPLCSSVDIWHTYYNHVLPSPADVVEWVKGTGLRPFVDPLPVDQKEGFLKAYLEAIKKEYPPLVDGSVMLCYPRLFLVATRG